MKSCRICPCSVTVLVNESGYQHRICLNPDCHYSVTKCAYEECKSWLQSRWSPFGVPCILSDFVLHLLAELSGLVVHLYLQSNSSQLQYDKVSLLHLKIGFSPGRRRDATKGCFTIIPFWFSAEVVLSVSVVKVFY